MLVLAGQLVAFVLVLDACSRVSPLAQAQTFHYSHGWTNGKRSVLAPISSRNFDDNESEDGVEADDESVNAVERQISSPGVGLEVRRH